MLGQDSQDKTVGRQEGQDSTTKTGQRGLDSQNSTASIAKPELNSKERTAESEQPTG